MCEYCEKGKEIRNDNNIKSFISKAHFGYSIIVQTNKLYLDVQNIGFINYCPICRKEAGRVRVANKNTILWEDVKIIFEDKYIKLFNDLEPDYENNCMKGLTLNDCLRIAKENGYKRGTIMVLSESYLDGDVYRYGNYQDDEWYEIGKLVGFA